MSYKQSVKENELLTKLKIIRLAQSPGVTNHKVATIFHCHRNTVSSICQKFKKLPQSTKDILLNGANLTINEIEDYLLPLKNQSSKPHSHPRQPDLLEDYSVLWLFYEKKWKVGYSSMYTKIQRSFHDYQTIDTHLFSLTKLTKRQIRGIYSRYELRSQKVVAVGGKTVSLYDYAALAAFEQMHYDVKILADQKSLPRQVYDNLLNKEIPRYQWTLIDAKTKFRFVAYSHNVYAEFGLKFLLFALLYIRFVFNNWSTHISVGMDNGAEFCSGSKEKLAIWNSILKNLSAQAYQYNPYFDVRKNIVERSHRTDDSHFLVPRGDLLTNKEVFLREATDFYHYYNFQKHHTGENMFDRTPYEALRDTGLSNPERLVAFPVMIIEQNIKTIRKTTDFLLLKSELAESKEKLSQKLLIDLSHKYSFFDGPAQKVLTKYPGL